MLNGTFAREAGIGQMLRFWFKCWKSDFQAEIRVAERDLNIMAKI